MGFPVSRTADRDLAILGLPSPSRRGVVGQVIQVDGRRLQPPPAVTAQLKQLIDDQRQAVHLVQRRGQLGLDRRLGALGLRPLPDAVAGR